MSNSGETTQHKKKKRNQKRFLKALRLTGNITKACESANIARKTHYLWVNDANDTEYQQDFEDAMNEAGDRLEEEARRRATEGVVEDVYYLGVKCGKKLKYSDNLLMFLLKGAKPDKYAERVKGDVKVIKRLEDVLDDD